MREKMDKKEAVHLAAWPLFMQSGIMLHKH